MCEQLQVAGWGACKGSVTFFGIKWPQWHTLIFEVQEKVGMRVVCPQDVKKMLQKQTKTTYRRKWAATQVMSRTETLSKVGPCCIVLTPGRVVYGGGLCVWPSFGDRWIMSTGVHINLLVALRGVAGKRPYPEEAEQVDQFGLPTIHEDLLSWVLEGQDADAVISDHESLHESIYKRESGFDWVSYFVVARRFRALRFFFR